MIDYSLLEDGEEIKEIEGFDNYYISNYGRVFSDGEYRKTYRRNFHELKAKYGKNPAKYGNISLSKDGKDCYQMIHRLVAKHFVPGYFDGAVVNHIDGNNKNNRADNLEWVTQKEKIHKSYASSGIDQYRHYDNWKLIDTDGNEIGTFKGSYGLKDFIADNNIPTYASSLQKYKVSCGYRLVKIPKETVTTIPRGVA